MRPLHSLPGNTATEYGIVLALVVGLSLYGLQTLGPAFSGNFKKVDSMGTLSLLTPLGTTRAGQHAGGNPGDSGFSDPDSGNEDGPSDGDPNISGPKGLNNVLDNPDQISDTPGYDNLVSGSLGQKDVVKPSKEDSEETSTQKPPQRPSSNTPSSRQPATAEVSSNTNDFTTGPVENMKQTVTPSITETKGSKGADTQIAL